LWVARPKRVLDPSDTEMFYFVRQPGHSLTVPPGGNSWAVLNACVQSGLLDLIDKEYLPVLR
jgi:hypothetical protein